MSSAQAIANCPRVHVGMANRQHAEFEAKNLQIAPQNFQYFPTRQTMQGYLLSLSSPERHFFFHKSITDVEIMASFMR